MPDKDGFYTQEEIRQYYINRDGDPVQRRYDRNIAKSFIDVYFLRNEFHVHSENLLPYFNDIEWTAKGISLYIYGNPGTHKTGQVTAILKKIAKVMSVRYHRTAEIVYQKDYDVLKEVGVLVLDNFGFNFDFEQRRGALFDLMDYRLHNYKSTIIITNKNAGDKVDPAFVDRLKMFVKIKIDGASDRKLMEVENAKD